MSSVEYLVLVVDLYFLPDFVPEVGIRRNRQVFSWSDGMLVFNLAVILFCMVCFSLFRMDNNFELKERTTYTITVSF